MSLITINKPELKSLLKKILGIIIAFHTIALMVLFIPAARNGTAYLSDVTIGRLYAVTFGIILFFGFCIIMFVVNNQNINLVL